MRTAHPEVHSQLPVDVLQIDLDGVLAYEKPVGDGAIVESHSQRRQHAVLLGRKNPRVSRPGRMPMGRLRSPGQIPTSCKHRSALAGSGSCCLPSEDFTISQNRSAAAHLPQNDISTKGGAIAPVASARSICSVVPLPRIPMPSIPLGTTTSRGAGFPGVNSASKWLSSDPSARPTSNCSNSRTVKARSADESPFSREVSFSPKHGPM